MGEKQIEIDKRLLRDRATFLRKKLDKVSTHRELYRERRAAAPVPVVALVGYTNAGKSSLLNALTESQSASSPKAVLAEDKLFATLDPTTRRVRLPDGKTVLATDTVGFIQRLPTNLVAAFRATLEEIKESSLLLHVVDVSSPLADAQIRAVDQVLDELGARDLPRLVVWNKCDALPGDGDGGGDDDDDGSGGNAFSFPGAEREKHDDDDDPLDDDASEEALEAAAAAAGLEPRADSSLEPRAPRVPAWIASAARRRGAVATSARTGAGVDVLAREIQRQLVRHSMVFVTVLLPYEEGKLLGEIRRVGVVETERYGDDGVFVAAHVPPPAAARLRRFAGFPSSDASEASGVSDMSDASEASGVSDMSETTAWSAEEEAELARLLLEEEAREAAETRETRRA
jgi:GTP-binding protein HflX